MATRSRIGIIECDHFPPETREVAGGDVVDLYRRMLGEADPSLELQAYDAVAGELPVSLDECDAWILTGSRADAHGDEKWVLALLDWIVEAAPTERMAGICFGHQAIAQALGGRVDRAAGWTVGPHAFAIDGTPWFARRAVAINAMHRDIVVQLPPGVTRVGAGTTAGVPAFIVGDNILCIQDHPEYDAAVTSFLIRSREERIGADASADGLERCERMPTEGAVVGRWLVDFLLDRQH